MVYKVCCLCCSALVFRSYNSGSGLGLDLLILERTTDTMTTTMPTACLAIISRFSDGSIYMHVHSKIYSVCTLAGLNMVVQAYKKILNMPPSALDYIIDHGNKVNIEQASNIT